MAHTCASSCVASGGRSFNRVEHRIETIEPTYRMEPKESERFIPRKVQDVIKEVITKKLDGLEYESAKCKILAQELATEIKARVKELEWKRYKLAVQSVIGEVKSQGCAVASRCLWDTETDNYASFSYKNETLFCVVMVFGLYLE